MDLTGHRYGNLVVIEFSHLHVQPSGQKPSIWKCRCDCGRECLMRLGQLRSGTARSCGCSHKDVLIKRNTTHGLSKKSAEYITWKGMRQRCSASYKGRDVKYYADRGITVCDEWLNGSQGLTGFQCFLRDMGPRPSIRHSIDRKDNNGGYSKDNCRWALPDVQSANRRIIRLLVVDGVPMTIPKAAKISGLKTATLRYRLKRGWTLQQALSSSMGSLSR